MTQCKHDYEFIEKSCGCEYEVCYRCPHSVLISRCDWCRREDTEE